MFPNRGISKYSLSLGGINPFRIELSYIHIYLKMQRGRTCSLFAPPPGLEPVPIAIGIRINSPAREGTDLLV